MAAVRLNGCVACQPKLYGSIAQANNGPEWIVKHTPPLFRARIWSMVLSLWRDVVCEKGRLCARTPLAILSEEVADLCTCRKHCVRASAVVHDGVVDFELHEANVRRATRGAALLSRALAAPAAIRHGICMAIIGLEFSDMRWWGEARCPLSRNSRCELLAQTTIQ
jgi:hypothetical protein